MGLRSSCQACQCVTSGVRFAYASFGYDLVNYIDDLTSAESESNAIEAFNCLGDLLSRLGLRESIEKATRPSTVMTFLGISFDTVACTLTIPMKKMTEVLVLKRLKKVVGNDKCHQAASTIVVVPVLLDQLGV